MKLVSWFNQVDATLRADIREQLNLNFARFDAKLEQRLGEAVARLDARIDRVAAELRAELVKWMFVFWIGSVVTIVGAIVGAMSLMI